MITVILLVFTFNNNEWVSVLSDHPQISPPWWWDSHKMRAMKNVAEFEDVRYLRPLFCIKTNVNTKQYVWRHWSRSNRTNQRPGRITIVVQLNHVSWSEFYVGATHHYLNLVQIYDQRWTWFSWTEIRSTLVKRALSHDVQQSFARSGGRQTV